MLYWTPEYGLEFHSAVLAMLDRMEVVEHRVWRSQAQLVLPQIDELRLALCLHLTHLYGSDWPHRWIKPRHREELLGVKSTPYACQWGHLEYLLSNCSALQSDVRWLSLVQCARTVRNELSHYRSISLDEYERLRNEVIDGRKRGLMMPSW